MIVLTAMGYFFVFMIYLPQQLVIPNEISTPLEFEITIGESISEIAVQLRQKQIINDKWAFVEFLKRENLDTKIEAGHFQFIGEETIPEVAEILLKSSTEQLSVTILEGWNSFEIDAKLTELGLIQPNAFALFIREGGDDQPTFVINRPTANIEGYIFPETYFIDPQNFSVDGLVLRMLTAMDENLQLAGWDSISSQRTLHEILTLASIVELEEKSEINRPLVADILWRRLDSGMGLYADATLFYALGHRENLTRTDLQTDSPYNTRLNRGLPPTPICSPSLSSIRAALHPKTNDFWYYLHDITTGEIHFAQTLEGHNRNKALFIR